MYIIADEDHVHLQKGGIKESRVVIVYDKIVSKGKRIELKIKNTLEKVYISGDGTSLGNGTSMFNGEIDFEILEVHEPVAIFGMVYDFVSNHK